MFCVAIGDIGRRIKLVRETYQGIGMKQTELARRVEVSQGRVSNYERGVHDPSPDLINRFAAALGVDSRYLLTGESSDAPKVVRERPTEYKAVASSSGRIKKIGYIGAGQPSGSIPLPDEQLQTVPAEFVSAENSALVVDGWSLAPYIHPGDILIFRDQSHGAVNKINAVVPVNESGPIAKKLIRAEDGYALGSFNPDFPPIPAKDATFHGVLIGIVGSVVIIGPIASGISEIEIEAELSARLPVGYFSRHRD